MKYRCTLCRAETSHYDDNMTLRCFFCGAIMLPVMERKAGDLAPISPAPKFGDAGE